MKLNIVLVLVGIGLIVVGQLLGSIGVYTILIGAIITASSALMIARGG